MPANNFETEIDHFHKQVEIAIDHASSILREATEKWLVDNNAFVEAKLQEILQERQKLYGVLQPLLDQLDTAVVQCEYGPAKVKRTVEAVRDKFHEVINGSKQ